MAASSALTGLYGPLWPVLLVAWIFQLLTAPVSAHMVGRAAYRSKHLNQKNLVEDELREVVARAGEEESR